MAPDLNTLPPARSMSSTSSEAVRDQTPSPRSRTASTSLSAAASVNAGLQREESHNRERRPSSGSISRNMSSPQADRRRSAVLMSLQLNDPTHPGPGELAGEHYADPHHGRHSSFGDHGRHASFGELHQELEQEQEATVNRLLHQIRQQQIQIDQLKSRVEELEGHKSES